MSSPSENLRLARQYLKTIESGAGSADLARFFAPEVIVEIFPSKFFPNGSRDNLAGVLAAAERGKKVISGQLFSVRNAVSSGDQVALEIDWTGTLAVPFETFPAGGEMRAHFAAFLEYKDGKIISQRNYDCYEP
jgi:ketosteroid isomerase-like protein